MPVLLLFIPALRSLRKTTYYVRNYARTIAASLVSLNKVGAAASYTCDNCPLRVKVLAAFLYSHGVST